MGRRVPLLVWIRLYIRQLLNVSVGLEEEVGRYVDRGGRWEKST